MCSIEDDIGEQADFQPCKLMLKNSPDLRDFGTCKKCEGKSVFLLHGMDPVCRSCFEVYCHHKFRSTVGKSKEVKPGHKVLIAYSGGLCSAAMVGFTQEALKDSSHKKKKYIPAVLHINESFFTNPTAEDKVESCATLKELKWPVLLTSLEMALRNADDEAFYWELTDGSSSIIPDPLRSQELKCTLMKTLDNTKSLSAKLDYLKLLKRQLISDVAKHGGFDFVFCGDSYDDLAVELLCDIAMGRGSQVSSDTSFCDTRYQVPICRPLRELKKKEIAFYNHLNNVSYEVRPSLITMTDSRMSIQRLTETFVRGLQENFSSTVHTIFRTGGKVSPMSSGDVKLECCIMCKSPLDNKNPDRCSAIELLSISSKISQNKEKRTSPCGNSGSDSGTSSCCCENKEFLERYQTCLSLDRSQNIMSHLCHGCQVTVEEMGLNRNLQPELMKLLKIQINRSKMEEEIQEFLIKD